MKAYVKFIVIFAAIIMILLGENVIYKITEISSQQIISIAGLLVYTAIFTTLVTWITFTDGTFNNRKYLRRLCFLFFITLPLLSIYYKLSINISIILSFAMFLPGFTSTFLFKGVQKEDIRKQGYDVDHPAVIYKKNGNMLINKYVSKCYVSKEWFDKYYHKIERENTK